MMELLYSINTCLIMKITICISRTNPKCNPDYMWLFSYCLNFLNGDSYGKLPR